MKTILLRSPTLLAEELMKMIVAAVDFAAKSDQVMYLDRMFSPLHIFLNMTMSILKIHSTSNLLVLFRRRLF